MVEIHNGGITTSMGAEMDLADDGGSRFDAYVEGLVSVIGHRDREGPLRDYCMGLMMPCARRRRTLAAVTAPARVAAQHQSLLHFSVWAVGRTSGCWPRCARGAAID